MVKCFTPAFGSSNGYFQIFLGSGLTDKISDFSRSQTDIQRFIFRTGLSGNNARNLLPEPFPLTIIK